MTAQTVVAATHNAGKMRELQALLAPAGFSLRTLTDCGIHESPEETGITFAENALLKARFAVEKTGLPAFADDSGLEVDALGGAPGVHSARYGAPERKTDAERTAFLLENLTDAEVRTARFVSCVVLLYPDGRQVAARGVCEGVITHAPRGENGFGYDPVFWLREYGATMAEIFATQKNEVSHRGQAVQLFLEALRSAAHPGGEA